MKVLFDHQIFSIQEYGGISRYFYELMHVFERSGGVKFHVAFKCTNNQYLTRLDSLPRPEKCAKDPAGWKRRISGFFKSKTSYQINQDFSLEAVTDGDYDVFHPTYYNPYFLRKMSGRPFVLTVHDMIHELYPEFFPGSDLTVSMKKQMISSAAEIICVSENTRQDLLRIYPGTASANIHVVYHGNSLVCTPQREPSEDPGDTVTRKKYLLYVGSRKAYKNFNFFILSSVRILKQFPWLGIVCAGGGTFTQEESHFFEQLGIKERISCLSADDRQLAALYMNACAFVFPSLYEGFGLPVLEAFACRCPVICSKASSFPEIAQDAALYFEPKDVISLQHALETVVTRADIREDMVKKGLERVKKFGWDTAAEQVHQVYKKASAR